MAMEWIEAAVIAGARRCKACEVLGISCRTLRRWKGAKSLTDQRKGAARSCPHALSEADKQAILAVCNASEYQSLPPAQIVPRLADQGIYLASESSFYRVLREYQQNNRRGRVQPPRKVNKPMALAATQPNQVWSWDITYLPTAIRGQFYRLYLMLDVYSRKIVAWEIHTEELASHAAVLMEKACLRHAIPKGQLVLHADNGGPMKGATMLATLQKLGIMPSFSRPSVSDDNPYSESLFRTLKYSPAYPSTPFASLEAARRWVHSFVGWYNDEHQHSGIGFVTPATRHAGKDKDLLLARKALYERVKVLKPARWNGRPTRNWTPKTIVWLNPDRKAERPTPEMKAAA